MNETELRGWKKIGLSIGLGNIPTCSYTRGVRPLTTARFIRVPLREAFRKDSSDETTNSELEPR
jgi:hypothetical protein